MTYRFWTPSETARLRKLYPLHSETVIAAKLGRTVPAVANRAVKLGLRKAADYVYPSRIKPGTPAWNKGIPNSTGTSATRFKKGNMPRTTKPLGSVGKTKEGHVLVKVAMPNVWVRKDVLDYEAKHGPLSPRLILRHREFVAVDRAANMRMNSYHRYPKEIARLIQLRGALNRQINKRVRNAQ